MSFNYPNASQAIQAGNSVHRLKAQTTDAAGTAITGLGPGDLIPIDVGFSAIAVGPESDYEKYELLYFDPTSPGRVQRVPFSVGSPFIGNISSDNLNDYPNGDGEKAKAFVRIADRGTKDGSLTGAAASARVAEAYSDLLIYTGAPPNILPTKRPPNRRSSNIYVDAVNDQFFYMPCYGRNYFFVSCIKQFATIINVTMHVYGVRLYNPLTSDSSLPSLEAISGKTVVQSIRKELLPSTAVTGVTGNEPLTFAYDCLRETEGYFDFLQVRIGSDTNNLPSDNNRGQGVHLTIEVRD